MTLSRTILITKYTLRQAFYHALKFVALAQNGASLTQDAVNGPTPYPNLVCRLYAERHCG